MSLKIEVTLVLSVVVLVAAGLFLFRPFDSVVELNVIYPFDNTLFPPDITAPTFLWQDSLQCDYWTVEIDCQDVHAL